MVEQRVTAAFPRVPCAFKDGKGSQNIGGYKGLGPHNRAVNMAFRREMDYRVNTVFLKDLLYKVAVTDIAFFKKIPAAAKFFIDFRKAGGVSRIGERV